MVPAQVKRLRRYVSQNEIVRLHLSLKQPSNAAPSGAEVEDDRIVSDVRSDLPREWDDFLDRSAATAPTYNCCMLSSGKVGQPSMGLSTDCSMVLNHSSDPWGMCELWLGGSHKAGAAGA